MDHTGSSMRCAFLAAAIAILVAGAPLHAADYDGDGVEDANDNCSEVHNAAQDDTDGDDCGNYCDADYNNNGVVDHDDVYRYHPAFGTPNNELYCHAGVIPGCLVGLDDFGFLIFSFGGVPGPSGTTAGTTACP